MRTFGLLILGGILMTSCIQTAQKDKFFNFTKGRIITLDY